MNTIISYLLLYNQYLLKQVNQLLLFIAKYIPLNHTPGDSKSHKYQKIVVDAPPIIIKQEPIDYLFLLKYYKFKYNKILKPIRHRKTSTIVPQDIVCPRCGSPHKYIYSNNGNRGQYLCKVCNTAFNRQEKFNHSFIFKCPYCGTNLVAIKDRKYFRIHKCINLKCLFYLQNLKKASKKVPHREKHDRKLHYIYREFTVDFFKMDLNSLPKNAINFNFKKFNSHILGLCLTFHVNLKQSTRQTSLAMEMLYGIKISHTTVAQYAATAAAVIKPYVDSYNYKPSSIFSADETYIKVKGINHYVWFIMDACKKSILGYQVSANRSVGPCILAMRMAFSKIKTLSDNFLFIADGYSAYPLASQQFKIKENIDFEVTQVIGLTNDDEVSTEYRWVKQIVERLNRTFKQSYRLTNGYNSEDGSIYGVSLWVAYYNFLRPHPYTYWKPLNAIESISECDLMPAKWISLIRLGQKRILQMQEGFP